MIIIKYMYLMNSVYIFEVKYDIFILEIFIAEDAL